MRLLKRVAMYLGIGVFMVGMFPGAVKAEQVGTFEGFPIYDNSFGGVLVEEVENATLPSKRGAKYATVHDPRTIGATSAIENQGETNTCWAFATIAAIESNLIKKGYENNMVDLSENHLAYFFYNRVTDPVGYTEGDKNVTKMFTHWSQNGGTLQGTALALTTWAGVKKAVTSEDDISGAYSPTDMAASECYMNDYRVANTYFYNYDVNTVKQAILDYGAVSSGIYIDKKYWDASTAAYYCPLDKGNHAVAIVGWDDNYSASNFGAYKPARNGAWIVKNSYGTTFGERGYMYVSYEDASLCEIVAYDMVRAAESYDKNYQHDGTAALDLYYYQPNDVSVANVFRVKSSEYNEELKAVAVNVLSESVNYTVQIYTGLTGSSPTSGTLAYKQNGTLTEAGYNTITLNKAVTLTPKEKYAVVIKLAASGSSSVKIGCDASLNADWIRFISNVGTGQSFVKYGGKWYDTGKASGANAIGIYSDDSYGYATYMGKTYANVRIKAYTDNTSQKTAYKLSEKNMGVSKGSSAKLSLAINPSSVKRNVTWTTANKNVATVSSSGKIKAKAYGTTTIKAKFVAGNKTKTLSCKVTVGPSKLKNYKVKVKKSKLTVTWKKNSDADGYEIYYSTDKNNGYKKLTTIKKASTTKYSKKLKTGTYYVKMRPYLNQNGKKLCGSYTAVKKIIVK